MLNFSIVLIAVISAAIAFREDGSIAGSRKQHIRQLLDQMESMEDTSLHSNKEYDYQKIFGSIVTEDGDNLETIYKPKQKRFLKGIFDSLFGKSEKTTTQAPRTFWTTPTTTSTRYTRTPSVVNKATDDVFYKLKAHCSKSYDLLCINKRQDLYDLVKKCDRLTNGFLVKNEACDDVLSIYCYVFYEYSVCFGRKYRPYQPGQKTASSTSPTRPSSTKRPIQIPVVVVTSTKYSTPRTWPKTTTKKSSSNLDSPFDGPVTSVPTDAKKLKEIGEYCLSKKDINCDKMLILLKDKFKKCEKQPKTDSNCQSFKIEFCTAFRNFPCCPDVLAGRQCNGKSNNSRRGYFNL